MGYQVKDLGMTLTEKWTTDNSLNTTIDVVDKLVPGLKVSLDPKFAPGTGAKSGALKTEYKHDAAMVTADLDLGLTALNATAVMGHKGWLAGYQTCFDLGKSVPRVFFCLLMRPWVKVFSMRARPSRGSQSFQ